MIVKCVIVIDCRVYYCTRLHNLCAKVSLRGTTSPSRALTSMVIFDRKSDSERLGVFRQCSMTKDLGEIVLTGGLGL
jgi:hypothetical protein